MFTSLKSLQDKINEGVKEFEATMQTHSQAVTSPLDLGRGEGAEGRAQAQQVAGRKEATISPSEIQSASQLADSALNSLRASFRKNRLPSPSLVFKSPLGSSSLGGSSSTTGKPDAAPVIPPASTPSVTQSETATPPVTQNETATPSVTQSETVSTAPVAQGDTEAPPVVQNETASSPAAQNETASPPAVQNETVSTPPVSISVDTQNDSISTPHVSASLGTKSDSVPTSPAVQSESVSTPSALLNEDVPTPLAIQTDGLATSPDTPSEHVPTPSEIPNESVETPGADSTYTTSTLEGVRESETLETNREIPSPDSARTEAGDAPHDTAGEQSSHSDAFSHSKSDSLVEVTSSYLASDRSVDEDANTRACTEQYAKNDQQLRALVKEHFPMCDPDDAVTVAKELKGLKTKSEATAQELERLKLELRVRDERLQEIRETHRLEIDSEKGELATLSRELATAKEAEDKLKTILKEEEEKRGKALSILRALRQKLTATEKERDDAVKEKGSEVRRALEQEKQRLEKELSSARVAHEAQMSKLKQSFEREMNHLKSLQDALVVSVREEHAEEMGVKEARIQQLETTVAELRASRDETFSALDARAAEVEAARTESEALRLRTDELAFELEAAHDRTAALSDELSGLRKSQTDAQSEWHAERTVEAEQRYLARIRELETRLADSDRDHAEAQADMGRQLQDRLREVERMHQQISEKDAEYAGAVSERRAFGEEIAQLRASVAEAASKSRSFEDVVSALEAEVSDARRSSAALQEELSERVERMADLENRLEELQNSKAALSNKNKILREEIKKLQSGVLMSENQRNPGVGYFANYSKGDDGPKSPAPDTAPTGDQDAAVNFEYVRNVILQFLEKPEMRPHLVSVLGVILHFTPAEQRRLALKVNAA